ncbi:hypothetical protein ILUMI_20870 [Ignelater luminosus]|uniref:Putative nuclease HARBI1 n=1 Tax=Ignelater luminosus TaxID=2038154 RepID=A0A8K0CFN1_IGNLU|nr:hypothetical protein ILUMI_20870 [Ignelater luminosus]
MSDYESDENTSVSDSESSKDDLEELLHERARPRNETFSRKLFLKNKKSFLSVVELMDGSHIKMDKPSTDPESYVNRKGYYSIQLQVVCDHNMRIMDVYVGYPGSIHDSRMFRTFPLAETLLQEKYWDHLTRAQTTYNLKRSKNRYIIEHCFGLLKQKFRQLYHIKLRSSADIVHLIRVCCVLHNLALEDELHPQDAEEGNVEFPLQQPEEVNDPANKRDDRRGRQRRDRVVQTLAY